jgi:hypothetical protein
MKIDAQVTISRQSNNEVHITLVDSASRIEFVDVKLSLEEFANAITGLSYIECEADVRRLDVVGKRKVTSLRTVICPLDTYDKGRLRAWLEESCQEDGWEIDSYLGSQGSVSHTSEGTRLHYAVYRYEEIEK